EELEEQSIAEVESIGENNDNNDDKDNEGGGVASAFEWLDSIVIALVAVIFIFTMVLGKVEVSGESMLDTLHDGDQLIITGYNYTPKRGDIVIIAKNASKTELGKLYTNKPLVKRVVATEGQTVEIKDGYLYVDNVKQEEDYARTLTVDNGFRGKQTVPEGCVFVLGDNRGDSADSRIIGFIPKQYVMGKVLCRIFPFDSITTF
ncbi:MAG: signal peptidase I, partial [Acutalibacteraceae bacterium]